jgi:lipopolysaccharide export system protein LptA
VKQFIGIVMVLALLPGVVLAQVSNHATGDATLDSDQPIEVVSDTLEVFQPKQEAVFKGNVIATQGNINMRAAKMIVYYNNSNNSAKAADGAGASDVSGQGIYKIDAYTNVFFTSPLETARGDRAVYNVDDRVINLYGNVLLTRQGNVLKGSQMTYNLVTGRSVLVGGATDGSGGSGRVRGLFVPQKEKKTP